MSRRVAFAAAAVAAARARPPPPPRRVSRRHLLRCAPAVAIAAASIAAASTAAASTAAAASGDIQAELSALAAPRHSDGSVAPPLDVYYPHFFLSRWSVTRELYAVELSDSASACASALPPAHTLLSTRAVDALRTRIGQRDSFEARFVRHQQRVVADRRFNARVELRADRVEWRPTRPDQLTVVWRRGAPGRVRVRCSTVTKRSFVDLGYGTFVSSEYARVVDFPAHRALPAAAAPVPAPSRYARRRLVRYKVSSLTDHLQPDAMQRIVVDYIYPPTPPDANYAMLLKYRDFLNRLPDEPRRFRLHF